MEIFLYLDKGSVIHKLHPVIKILCLLLLFTLAMVFNHPIFMAVLLAFVLLIVTVGKLWLNLKRTWWLIALLAVFSMVLWPFFSRGPTLLWRLGWLKISRESLLYGMAMALRINLMLISGLIFLSCTKIEEFMLGLRKLGLPFSVSFAFSLAFRLVPTLMGTASTILQAQQSRGLDLETGGLLKRIKKHIPLLIPIFIYAIRSSDLLAMASESKGFGASKERSYYLRFRLGVVDYVALVFLLALTIGCFYLRSRGYGTILPRL